jgi:hypothetical protein
MLGWIVAAYGLKARALTALLYSARPAGTALADESWRVVATNDTLSSHVTATGHCSCTRYNPVCVDKLDL